MLKKTTVLLAVIAMFTLTSSVTLAASGKCTVTEIKDSVVTLDCGTTAAKLKIGDEVKVKTAKKKAIEGC
jgi:hypothetical protein